MKLLFLATEINYGGASKIFVSIANNMAQSGHEVTFLTWRRKSDCSVLNENIHYDHLECDGKITKYFTTIKSIIDLRSYIISHEFDVAIAFLGPSILRLICACWNTNVKTIVSERGDPYFKQPNIILRLKNIPSKLAFNHADCYVFQIENAKSYYASKIRGKKIYIIPNPIACRPNSIHDKSENRIVSVGRLDVRQKRQDVLIKAFAKISSKYPDYTLEFYGDGKDEDYLRKIAKPYTNILFKGKVDNAESYIKDASLFVMSSDFEGMPNALMEAMSIGLPCISTDCSPGGAAELINNEVNGLLVPCNNIEKMAESIDFMLLHKDKAEQMGEEARKIVYDYSLQKVMNMWNEVFNDLKD
ncbi:MAG: glycosyltransferase [Vallitaleaceae bacterium]|nr:glycosyltransferase [Vallitaleaceae bacterium]